MNVGALNAILSLTIDQSGWAKGEDKLNHFRRLGAVVGGIFAGKALGGALIGFNMSVENAKNQVASMLALGSGSTMESQLVNANNLYDELRRKAATLPGQTEDYINMLGLLAQPLSRAKVSLTAMSDITSGSFVMAKAMGISWQEASRDLRDYINQGKVTTRDKFLLGMLQGSGVDTNDVEKARAQSKKLGVEGRAKLIQKQTTGPLAKEMATRLGNSFEGRLDTVKEAIKQTLGKVGQGLFDSLKGSMDKLATWFTTNQDVIAAWAATVGGYIAGAFEAMQNGILWLIDHQSVLEAFFVAIGAQLTIMAARAIIGWAALAWPVVAGAALFFAFGQLAKHLGALPTIFIAIAATALLAWLGVLGPMALLVILIAAIVAAFYYASDNILGFLQTIGEKIMWVIEKAKEAFDAIFGLGGGGIGQSLDEVRTKMNGTEGPQRTLSGADAAGGVGYGTTVTTGPTEVNIYTADTKGAKDAFKSAGQDLADAAMRAAYGHQGGKS